MSLAYSSRPQRYLISLGDWQKFGLPTYEDKLWCDILPCAKVLQFVNIVVMVRISDVNLRIHEHDRASLPNI